MNSSGNVKVAAVTSERPVAGMSPVCATVAFGVNATVNFSFFRYASSVGIPENCTLHGLAAQDTGVVLRTPEAEPRSSAVPATGKLGMAVLSVGRACVITAGMG